MFLLMGGNISSLDVRIEEAELILKNFQATEGLYGKTNYIFRWKFILISI